MEKLTEELKLQMEGVISEFHKMNTSEKYGGKLFKFGNANVLISRGTYADETREHNFIFLLDREYTFIQQGTNYRIGVDVPRSTVEHFIKPNMKLFPNPDYIVLLKPSNYWDNKHMKTKKDREHISRHLGLVISSLTPKPKGENDEQ